MHSSADSDPQGGTIGEDEDRSDGTHMFLDLGRNTLLVDLVLLEAMGVGRSRGVEDTNLGKMVMRNYNAYKRWCLPPRRSCS